MAKSFFFYDLETSGFHPREDRIMQFAGQRTDEELNPIGNAYNIMIRLGDDTLPSPEATLVTHITPQQTIENGISESEFCRLLIDEICLENTTTVGFNNIRFDDEFIRALLWRNFHDPYEWCWKNGCSRWDMLDVIRMTRALRPEGIEWPTVLGKPSNRLELLTKANSLTHEKAHDAMSDVDATIAIAKLIRERQRQLFDYLLRLRDKNEVKKLVSLNNPLPFVYTSGRYSSEYVHTTIAYPIASGRNGNVVVYDLRIDPTPFISLSVDALRSILALSWDSEQTPLPVKELQCNRAPAVAPLGVMERGGAWDRLKLDPAAIQKHISLLNSASQFKANLNELFARKADYVTPEDAECRLYDGFLSDQDRTLVEVVRSADEKTLKGLKPGFKDPRLGPLFVRYKARNFPWTLTDEEAEAWDEWRSRRLSRLLPGFVNNLSRLAATRSDEADQFVLTELQLWAESIMPTDAV